MDIVMKKMINVKEYHVLIHQNINMINNVKNFKKDV